MRGHALRLMTAPFVVGAMLAACGGQESSEPAGTAAEGASPLVVRTIDARGERGTVEAEGLYAVDPGTGTRQALSATDFVGGDAQFPLVYSGDAMAFRCSRGACVTGA